MVDISVLGDEELRVYVEKLSYELELALLRPKIKDLIDEEKELLPFIDESYGEYEQHALTISSLLTLLKKEKELIKKIDNANMQLKDVMEKLAVANKE
jgi:hypothetical protein